MYKINYFVVGMDLLRNYNFWAFQTDFIEPDLYLIIEHQRIDWSLFLGMITDVVHEESLDG